MGLRMTRETRVSVSEIICCRPGRPRKLAANRTPRRADPPDKGTQEASMTIAYAVCLIAMVAIVAAADHFYPILRDTPVDTGTAHTQLPYSLGRIQMAFWTIIVVGSIVYV